MLGPAQVLVVFLDPSCKNDKTSSVAYVAVLEKKGLLKRPAPDVKAGVEAIKRAVIPVSTQRITPFPLHLFLRRLYFFCSTNTHLLSICCPSSVT